MDQKTKTSLLFLIMGIVVGGVIMGVLVTANMTDRMNTIKEAKEIIVYELTPLEDLDFQIVRHDRSLGFIDEEAHYWTKDYFIRVFRVGDTYYIKIYTFAEFNGE